VCVEKDRGNLSSSRKSSAARSSQAYLTFTFSSFVGGELGYESLGKPTVTLDVFLTWTIKKYRGLSEILCIPVGRVSQSV
jgi:hypothetical protein